MTAALKRQIKAAEYLDKATAASDMAKSSLLAHVREKHETAAVRWRELAALNGPHGDAVLEPPMGG